MVSVVVPVYNVEKYLDKCVDSLINQTYKDIEILLVDDGAKDNSGTLCDEYEKKDSRIKALHKENGGLSDARNYGMERANGEYILFIDSDDFVELDMVEFLMSKIGDCDVVTCGVYNDYVSGSVPQCADETPSFITDNISAFKLILQGNIIPGTICNKLMKTELARKQQFPKGMLYEDAFYTNKLMFNIKSVSVNTKPLYHYVHREGSITTSAFKPKDTDVIKAYEETVNISKTHPEIASEAYFRLYWAHFVVLDRILALDNFKAIPEYKSVVKFLRKNTGNIIKNQHFTTSRRVAAMALKCHISLYRFLLRQNLKRTALCD